MFKGLTKVPTDQQESKDLVASLRSLPENKCCFDCNKRVPSWCSVSNGVFLCMDCCSRHRGMGVHVSFMRSADLDDWEPAQAVSMALGGNSRAREFFRQHGITDTKNSYSLPAAVQYRRILGREVQAAMALQSMQSTGDKGSVQNVASHNTSVRAPHERVASGSSFFSISERDRSCASRCSSSAGNYSGYSSYGSLTPTPATNSSMIVSTGANCSSASPSTMEPIPLSSTSAFPSTGKAGGTSLKPKKKGLGGACRLEDGNVEKKQ